ncbi:MAG TPA: glycosyltransferase family 4 protein [Puia sp.]|nr:glycosyltransferase family 4 protein [Puia sp.]
MPSKRSIAFVANTSWSIYKFRLYLIKKLIEHGFAIYVLAPRDPYTALFESLPGLTYIELIKFRGKSISPLHDLQLFRELTAHYRKIQPDLIFHYTIKANIFGSLAAARTACPSVSVITGLGYAFSGNPLLQTSVKTIYRRVLQKNAETWFLNSDDQRVFVTEKLIRKEKTFLLPGEGVDTGTFYPAPYSIGDTAIANAVGTDTVTFLLIARIIKHKGIYEFVQAARLLIQRGLSVKFQLLGFFDEGNPVAISPAQVEEWSRQHNITYLGHTDNVTRYIEQADCIVLPSYREGMPLSLLEGASMCKALIATDTAGCREVIRDGVNGYLCRKRDGADLADKMEKYYRLTPEEKRQMGIEGRNRIIQYFTKEIVFGIYLDKINRLSRNPSHPS